MNSNGPRPSQDPRFNSNDPNKPSTNDPNRPFGSQQSSYSQKPIQPEPTVTYQGTTATPSTSPSPYNQGYQSKSTTDQMTDKLKDTGEKLKSSFRDIKNSKQVDDMYRYAVSNKEKTTTYILLVLGLLILLFINDVLGGLIIGLVAGYYFSNEIVAYIRGLPQFFEGQDQVRYAVLGALIIGLLIEAPGILIGAAVIAAFRYIINRNDRDDRDEDRQERDQDKTKKTNGGNGNGNRNR